MRKQLKERLTCSGFSAFSGESLFGTAPIWDGCICIEIPLPWEPDILFSDFFRRHFLSEELNQYSKDFPRFRIIGITSDSSTPENGIRVLSFQNDGHKSVKTSYAFPEEEFRSRLLSLINNGDCKSIKPFMESSDGAQDYLVCTHGNRDVCCGFWGYQLYKQLADNYSSPSVRIWRASHIGGHKFAPTVVSLDDARFWVRVEAKSFAHVIHREKKMETINPMYRGKATCRSFQEQLIEKEFFSMFAWDLDHKQLEIQLSKDDVLGAEYTVSLIDTKHYDNVCTRYQVRIQKEPDILTYGCITKPSFNSGKQYRVVDFQQVR